MPALKGAFIDKMGLIAKIEASILKFEVSFFEFFNIAEINFYRLNLGNPTLKWKFV